MTHDNARGENRGPDEARDSGPDSLSAYNFYDMFRRLLHADGQSRAARTVEIFGWLLLVEGVVVVLAPHLAAKVLQLPELGEQAANYFRLVGLLVTGIGMLYTVSGRLNAYGFVFASLLDRPLSPIAMAVLWYCDIIPGPLALVFSITDFATFLWTLLTWRAEMRSRVAG